MITILFENNNKPLYIQIYEFIKREIREGSLLCNEKLPSKRKLAQHLAVSVNTVDAAYSQLVAEGYIEPAFRKGYFVCHIEEYLNKPKLSNNEALARPKPENYIKTTTEKIDFSPSDIDNNVFPFNSFRKIFKSVFSEYDLSILKRPNPQGDIGLRMALKPLLYRLRGVKCSEEQIIIGAGTDNLLQTLNFIFGQSSKSLCIVFENPVYIKAYKIFQSMGNRVLSVDIDEKGIQIEPLKTLSAFAVYITPSHHFPLGISMPIDRRIKLLNFINETENAYIIEDDYDSEFRYNEKPLPSLQSIDKGEKVIYIGTFSKSIAPSIRISYMILPPPLLKTYYEKCLDLGSCVSTLEQKMVTEFINSGDFERHINKMRKIYKEKRITLINEFKTFGDNIKIIGENAGHHLLVKLKNKISEREMCEQALKFGVKVYPISPYFLNGVTREHESEVLIGYGALSHTKIKNGINLLKKAWLL